MALFGKKKEEKNDTVAEAPVKKTKKAIVSEDLSWVLESPRLTEKAAIKTSDGVYTFNIHDNANKIEVKKAVKALYKVDPIKIRVIRNKPEQIFARGYRGTKKGFKKAMVYLKKGDTIDFA